MKRGVKTVLALAVFAGAWYGVSNAHRAFETWWLDIYLVIFVALPMFPAVLGLADGRAGFKNFVTSVLSVSAGLFVASFTYQHFVQNWLWACVAGTVLPSLYFALQESRVNRAHALVRQAEEALEANQPRRALQASQAARRMFVRCGDSPATATTELLQAVAYEQMGEGTRSARYANSARALYLKLGDGNSAAEARKVLDRLAARGVNVHESEVNLADSDDQTLKIDWAFMLNGVLALGCSLGFLKLWDWELVRSSTLVLSWLGLGLFLITFGNYALYGLLAPPSRRGQRSLATLLFFNLMLVAFIGSLLALLFSQSLVYVADFPSHLRPSASAFNALVEGGPAWLLFFTTPATAMVALITLADASGRSPMRLLEGALRGNVRSEALQLASAHLEAGEWREAAAQLSRLDLVGEKDAALRARALLALGFAHHNLGHPAEAQDYARQVLEVDPQHRQGLYFAGYLALREGTNEEAEQLWRTLHEAAGDYGPSPTGGEPVGASYYLSVALYRRAMEVMKRDFEGGTERLTQVGMMGALDREVSDALVRVHLIRAAELLQQRKFDRASEQARLAADKLQHLDALVTEPEENRRLRALCYAAGGLVAFLQKEYSTAAEAFQTAAAEGRSLARTRIAEQKGDSFFEQLLRTMMQREADGDKLHNNFGRDLYFLKALARLRELELKKATEDKASTKRTLDGIQAALEESIAVAPQFVEGRALLGLLYFYRGADHATSRKGVELLQSVRDLVSSGFIAETLKQFEARKQEAADARQAYFNLLQQYLQYSNVPRDERESLRERVLERMKTTGEYEDLLGRGGLEIVREQEPTVQEYVTRAGLLRAKIEQLLLTERSEGRTSNVKALIGQLDSQSQELSNALQNIARLEQQILIETQELL